MNVVTYICFADIAHHACGSVYIEIKRFGDKGNPFGIEEELRHYCEIFKFYSLGEGYSVVCKKFSAVQLVPQIAAYRNVMQGFPHYSSSTINTFSVNKKIVYTFSIFSGDVAVVAAYHIRIVFGG